MSAFAGMFPRISRVVTRERTYFSNSPTNFGMSIVEK